MRLKCVYIPTTDVAKMRDFYSLILRAQVDETNCNPGNCNIIMEDGITLVLSKTQIPPTVHPDNCGLEFVTQDVDREYQRLLSEGVAISGEPVTYPWQWRAFGLKDPDGNHISFVQKLQEGSS